tara:strand:- start:550 stop:828 length:279 start_codon:yes stop_codon:yes gene_type:complete
MKITKSQLKKMILEELSSQSPKDRLAGITDAVSRASKGFPDGVDVDVEEIINKMDADDVRQIQIMGLNRLEALLDRSFFSITPKGTMTFYKE